MTSVTRDYWPAYRGLEGQLRDVARMATIARFYAHEIEWPKDLTDYQSEEICRLFLLVGQVEDMAETLVKTYDAGFQSGAQSGEAADDPVFHWSRRPATRGTDLARLSIRRRKWKKKGQMRPKRCSLLPIAYSTRPWTISSKRRRQHSLKPVKPSRGLPNTTSPTFQRRAASI
jgi:hypothetical protein